MSDTEKYMEHMRLQEVQAESHIIGEFLDWLTGEKGVVLGTYNRVDTLMPLHTSIEELLAEFYEIDLKALEMEKRKMLKEQKEVPS